MQPDNHDAAGVNFDREAMRLSLMLFGVLELTSDIVSSFERVFELISILRNQSGGEPHYPSGFLEDFVCKHLLGMATDRGIAQPHFTQGYLDQEYDDVPI